MDTSFLSFLKPDIDRVAFISNWLSLNSIPYHIVNLSGKKHIIVKFDNESYDPRFRQKILVSHHDRVTNTPGANDNSAACYQLLLFAKELYTSSTPGGQRLPHNIKIIFTDGEEAAGIEGIHGQGSYRLGKGLLQIGISSDDLYVLDATGTGDTLVISTTGISRDNGRPASKKLLLLHDGAIEMAQSVSPENWVQLPTPFSDNAGFLASGIPAQVITILPHEEATKLLLALNEGTKQQISMISRKITMNTHKEMTDLAVQGIPETWLRLHTGSDTAEMLTKDAFTLIRTFLWEVAKRHVPA